MCISFAFRLTTTTPADGDAVATKEAGSKLEGEDDSCDLRLSRPGLWYLCFLTFHRFAINLLYKGTGHWTFFICYILNFPAQRLLKLGGFAHMHHHRITIIPSTSTKASPDFIISTKQATLVLTKTRRHEDVAFRLFHCCFSPSPLRRMEVRRPMQPCCLRCLSRRRGSQRWWTCAL